MGRATWKRFARLVESLGHPAKNVILDRKLLRRRAHEPRLQGKRMGFERNREVRFRLHEALYEELGVALQAEDLKLDRMHQGMEQRAFRDRLVEDQNVDERQGIHVGDLGEVVESESAGLGIEGGHGQASA